MMEEETVVLYLVVSGNEASLGTKDWILIFPVIICFVVVDKNYTLCVLMGKCLTLVHHVSLPQYVFELQWELNIQ